jgi:hypothetical protein
MKRLLKENDTQQLWNGMRRLAEVKKQRKEVDPVKARDHFKGLLGMGSSEWGLTSENNVPRPEKRREEEIDLEEIHSYLKKAKNGKAVGVDGYPMEFWKELYLVQRSVETTYYTVNGHCSCRPANIRLFHRGIFN